MITYELEIVDAAAGQFEIINKLLKIKHQYSIGDEIISGKLIDSHFILQTRSNKFLCMSANSAVCIWEFMFYNKDGIRIECWHANKKHLIIHYSDCTTEYVDINSGRLIQEKS